MKKIILLILAVLLCFSLCACAGKSAYEIAVENGFEGTELEWLESLRGQDGEDGRDGASGAMGQKGDKGNTGSKGDKGDKGDAGVGIVKTEIAPNGHLMITMTDGTVVDAGYVRGELEDLSTEAPVLSVSTLSLLTGDTYIINSNRPVNWKSDNEAAILVASNGFVVAVGEGTATVTATASDGKSSTCTVTAAPFEAKLKPDNTYMITAYNGFAQKLAIPETIKGLPVSEIGTYAMWDNAHLTELTIPDSLKKIGDGAFAICENLKTVNLGTGLEEIGSAAFSGCSLLESIELPESLRIIGDSAFGRCGSLLSVTVPDNVEKIEGATFGDCVSLESVTFGASVKSIGMMAFDGCRSLTEIKLPDSITFIDEFAFAGCKKLSKLTLGTGLEAIPYRAFYECVSLAEISVSATVTSIADEAFAKCSLLRTVTFESEKTDYSINAFLDTPYHYDYLVRELGYVASDKTMWTGSVGINVRDSAIIDESEVVGYIDAYEQVKIIFELPDTTWVGIVYEGSLRYVNSAYLFDTDTTPASSTAPETTQEIPA